MRLMCLMPYLTGMMRRSGAPFSGESGWPFISYASSVCECIMLSMSTET
jgi:hypothetical protein